MAKAKGTLYIVRVGVAILVSTGWSCASRVAAPMTNTVVARVNAAGTHPVVNTAVLRTNFEDGLPISSVRVEKWGTRLVLIREGRDTTHSKVTATDLSPDENGNLALTARAITETCSGSPCSFCAFATGGGCICNDKLPNGDPSPSGFCNHTISNLAPHMILNIDTQ